MSRSFWARVVARAGRWFRRPAAPSDDPLGESPTHAGAELTPRPTRRPDSVRFLLRPTIAPSSVPTILLAMVNRERGMKQLERVDLDLRLITVAEAHCDQMADAARCHHVVGSEPPAEERVLASGYAFVLLREAVAAGQRTAQDVVRDWLTEPESRNAVLDPDVHSVGFGLAVAADTGRHYWTAIFAAPQPGASEGGAASAVRLAPPVVREGGAA